ncbi:hypothetical protein AB0B50_13090 [Streptomyces sp. NPDC041068]|uniref:hypothetical protein n=1 Tax=Streptomyces sp. NPDC041068 TaxID=3155130 RepID=UPI0033F1F907
MLLEEVPVAGKRLEELPAVWEEGAFEVSADDRYLLDLSSVTDADYPAAERSLIHYRSVVEQGDARLVVVLPIGLDWMLHADLSPLVVTLERPRGRAVFSRHLRVRGVPFEPEQLDTDELQHLFTTAPMRELARLAELVAEARDTRRYGTNFATWRDEAVDAATNWAGEVARQLREHRRAQARALLLAAAMVSDAPAEVALRSAQLLLEVLRHEADDSVGLARADLGEQLTELGIERSSDGRVVFRRLAYDSAVRRHFWTNFPDLRPDFRDWVERCIALPELRAESRMNLIARFAEQVLSTGRPDDLCSLVEAWTDHQRGRFRAEAAAALELGLSHEQYGSYFRSRVYSWVTSRISPDLAHVLTDVCQQVIAATHPEQAAVRLRYLSFRQQGTARVAARKALLDVARANRRVFRQLTDRIASLPLTEDSAELLLELLEPVPLRIEPPQQEFTLAWRALLVVRPVAEWKPVLHRWLDALARRPPDDRMASALIVAAVGDYSVLNRLYVAVCQWQNTPLPSESPGVALIRPEVRRRISDHFCREIDVLLGMECGAHTAANSRETGECV